MPEWFTRENFKAFLDKAPADSCYLRMHSCACPIAMFILSRMPELAAIESMVSVGKFRIHFAAYNFEAPVWARQFIQAFDWGGPVFDAGTNIEARHALANVWAGN